MPTRGRAAFQLSRDSAVNRGPGFGLTAAVSQSGTGAKLAIIFKHSRAASNSAQVLPHPGATCSRIVLGKRFWSMLSSHSPNYLRKPGWPPVPGKEGSGFDYSSWGYPGQVAPNITPDGDTGADMLARAIREGVAHDGHLLDPAAMPYEFYRSMSDADLAPIIAYLRQSGLADHFERNSTSGPKVQITL